MWGRKTSDKAVSNFFEGTNIGNQLFKSMYGRIMEIFQNSFSEKEIKEYKLPRVIVVGNESSGKSSLLENITKCQLFPRDSKMCTKCPILVRMISGDSNRYTITFNSNEKKKETKLIDKKEDIYTEISKYMKTIPEDTILDDEVVIEIVEKGLNEFEFLDLPGIRSYPPVMANMTINVYKKYLSYKNSIILCVVPATITSLTSCQSIALINKLKLEKNCIVALTMCDRLQASNTEELLIDRILGKSDEFKGLDGFAGCVGVVNRTHTDEVNLSNHDLEEVKWFDQKIIQVIPEEFLKYKDEIENNVTINNLIKQMDVLYNKFFENDWKPRMLKTLDAKIKSKRNEFKQLGDLPVDVDTINNKLNEFISSQFTNYNYTPSLPNLPDIKNPSDECLACHVLINWVNDKVIVEFRGDILNFIRSKINKFFAEDNKYVLYRFSKVKQLLIDNISAEHKILCIKSTEHICSNIQNSITSQYACYGTIKPVNYYYGYPTNESKESKEEVKEKEEEEEEEDEEVVEEDEEDEEVVEEEEDEEVVEEEEEEEKEEEEEEKEKEEEEEEETPVKASYKQSVKAPYKHAKTSAKILVKASTKAFVKAWDKASAKASAKASDKASAKASDKASAKASAKTPVKEAPSKAPAKVPSKISININSIAQTPIESLAVEDSTVNSHFVKSIRQSIIRLCELYITHPLLTKHTYANFTIDDYVESDDHKMMRENMISLIAKYENDRDFIASFKV